MKKFYGNKNFISITLSVILSFAFVAVAAYAATTIGTNVNTEGTLTVTGATTIYGATSIGGALTATSTLTVSGITSFAGNASTTGSAILKSATINSDTGAISFGDENLSTSGTLTLSSGALSFVNASSTGWIKVATINSDTGAISFGDENLTTTGAINFATASSTGTATLDSLKISSTGTSIAGHVSGGASLDFGVIGANSCSALTITVTGAADGDTVSLGVPNALASASSTLTFFGWVSAVDTVSVRVCQVAAQATSDPAAATIRADVWKH